MTFENKTVLVTGGSMGLGLALVEGFLREGARVATCSRDPHALAKVEKTLAPANGSNFLAMTADVSSEKDVAALVAKTFKLWDGIDVLVCNAGIYGPKGPVESGSFSEWQKAVEINLYGVVHSCRAVLPHFKNKKAGKIIILAGGGATKPMPNFSAYAASKAAVVRFAETLAEEVAPFGIDVNTVAPGALNTRLVDEVLEAGPEKVGRAAFEANQKIKSGGGVTYDAAVELCLFLASRESNGLTGRLISAVWDQWRGLPQKISAIKATDVFTLRRIVPQDRGLSES